MVRSWTSQRWLQRMSAQGPEGNPGDAQLQEIPLGGGLDETNEDAYVPYNAMRACQNVVFPDANTSAKRPGLTTIGATIPYARKLIPYNNEVLVSDGVSAWGYSESQATYLSKGNVSPCTASRTLLGSGPNKYDNDATIPVMPLASIAVDVGGGSGETGLQVTAWYDGLNYLCSVFDPANQKFIYSQVVIN